MNVVFLALGATRRSAVVAESARVVASGGSATVVLDQRSLWKRDRFPDGVDVVELPELEDGYRPRAVTVLLFRVPKAVFRALTPGPLRGWGDRISGAFRRRVARPADRALARIYRRDAARVRRRSLRRAVLDGAVLGGATPDLVVVADAQSLSPAADLARTGAGRRLAVAFYAPPDGGGG